MSSSTSVSDFFAGLKQKVSDSFSRFQNKEFAEALVVVCALVTAADKQIDAKERVRTAQAFESDPLLAAFDKGDLRKQYNEWCDKLVEDFDMTSIEALGIIRKHLKGNEEQAITAISKGILIAKAEAGVSDEEKEVLKEICKAAGVKPDYFVILT